MIRLSRLPYYTIKFQSTLPAWGATKLSGFTQDHKMISIHALRMGSDGAGRVEFPQRRDFNPRSPHGERRPGKHGLRRVRYYFNPRSPHGERPIMIRRPHYSSNFNPRSPHGERRSCTDFERSDIDISIHAPRMGSDLYPYTHLLT